MLNYLLSNYFSQSVKYILNLYIIFHYGFENLFLISRWNIFVRNVHTIFCNKLIHWSTVSLNNILGVLRSAGKCWEEGGEAYENFLVKNKDSPLPTPQRGSSMITYICHTWLLFKLLKYHLSASTITTFLTVVLLLWFFKLQFSML